MADIKEMFHIFCKMNPNDSKKCGLVKGFAQTFQKKFAYDFEILLYISKCFVVARVKLINLSVSNSVRAKKKELEYVANGEKVKDT